ncbi:Protein of unknown function [Pyronema omphalodes CBS 100304]|uniref:Uncharacterized protein n=1 Tax=Pyronema omphalodes (strain CBS 100304) TaxID=1076935 RepID=U4LIF4_PYROM|nr:Protein of unknown function [Pyronema omphalodes CBS 100304]
MKQVSPEAAGGDEEVWLVGDNSVGITLIPFDSFNKICRVCVGVRKVRDLEEQPSSYCISKKKSRENQQSTV